MALKVTIAQTEEVKPDIQFNLHVRKTLAGDYIMAGHPQIDIVYSPEKSKITSFTKEKIDNCGYASHDSLYKRLYKRGIVDIDSVIGGNIYSSFEASVLEPKTQSENLIPIVLMNISEWIEEDSEKYNFVHDFKDLEEEELLEPDKDSSTELGEVPQAPEKGSMSRYPLKMYSPYAYYYE
jgi:hypothetical protein